MPLNNRMCEAATHALQKHSVGVRPAGPWHWRAALQNGSMLHLEARFGDGFLHLATSPFPSSAPGHLLERAMRANATLFGVRFALDAASRNLHLRADLLALDEARLAGALERAVGGFHTGALVMASLDAQPEPAPPVPSELFSAGLADLLREVAWPCTQRSASEFSAELDAEAAPPATLISREGRIETAVELVRSNVVSGTVRRALAAFLLTANSALCFCQASSEQIQDQEIYRLRSSLAAASPEQVESALAGLSVAYRTCAREATVLLNETAAQVYLSARHLNPHSQPACNKEDLNNE